MKLLQNIIIQAFHPHPFSLSKSLSHNDKMPLNSLLVYSASTLLIFGWWFLAFSSNFNALACPESKSLLDTIGPHLNRSSLHQALSGDFHLIASLIEDWDKQAEIYEGLGIKSIKRVGQEKLQKSQTLGLILQNPNKTRLWNEAHRLKCISDDLGVNLNLERPFPHFLPQTHMAASFLLTLVEPHQIMAIPEGLRKQTNLHPRSLTDKIPLNLQQVSLEKIFLSPPGITFVANYSNPLTISALKAQGIPLFTIKNVNSVSMIQEQLLKIGHCVQRSCEAELLHIFIDAAFYAIDNSVLVHQKNIIVNPRKVLYLSHYGHFSMPTQRSLTGDLLKRLNISLCAFSKSNEPTQNQWITPISSEMIAHYNPERIIISITGGELRRAEFIQKLKLSGLESLCSSEKLCLVDEEIQQSPSQYIVLSYYDLSSAIIKLYNPL